jgi:hypothetical protein
MIRQLPNGRGVGNQCACCLMVVVRPYSRAIRRIGAHFDHYIDDLTFVFVLMVGVRPEQIQPRQVIPTLEHSHPRTF